MKKLRQQIREKFRFSTSDPARLFSILGDVGIAGCLFLTPLLLGGRHDFARLIYVVCACFASVGVYAHAVVSGRKIHLPFALICLLVGAISLVGLQSVPLPQSVLEALGPDLSETLPSLKSTDSSGWGTLSLTPVLSVQSGALLIAHSLLLLALLARIRDIPDIRKFLACIAISVVVMTFLGLLQQVLGNGKILWLYDQPQREMGPFVQGAFDNKNHFSHFLVLGLGSLCFLFAEWNTSSADTRKHFNWVGWPLKLMIVCFSCFLLAVLKTQSRGGIVVLVISMTMLAPIYWRVGFVRLRQVVLISIITLVALFAISFTDYERVADRVDDLFSGSVATLDTREARRSIWNANIEAFIASPIVGFGTGSHREVYPLFLEKPFSNEFTHAESGYLQIASESGLLGLALLGGLFAFTSAALYFGLRQTTEPLHLILWGAIAQGLVASATHSLVDFVWYIPSIMAFTVGLIACAIRLEQLTRVTPTNGSIGWRMNSSGMLYATAFAGIAAVSTCLGPAKGSADWDRYLRGSVGLRGMIAQLPMQDQTTIDPHLGSTIVQTTTRMTETLERVVLNDPLNARAHLRLAGRLLQRYELAADQAQNGMPIDPLRDAVLKGGFESHQAMQIWLDRALEDRADLLRKAYKHAQIAVQLSPLQGEGYLYMASLCFLDSAKYDPLEFVDQALAVRPHDGRVLFEAGRQYWMAGNAEKGIELWKLSINYPGSHRPKLVAMLAGSTPAEVFLKQIQPDYEVVNLALQFYRRMGREADLVALSQYAVKEATKAEASGSEEPGVLAYRWRHASETYRSLQQYSSAVQCAEHAVKLAPYVLTMRLELATALYHAEQFDEADPHIRWCLARRPDIRYLQQWLQESAKRRTLVDRNRRDRKRLYATLSETPTSPSETIETEASASRQATLPKQSSKSTSATQTR